MRDLGLGILEDDNNSNFLSHKNTLNINPEPGVKFYNVSHDYFQGKELDTHKRLDYSIGVEYLNDLEEEKLPHEWRISKSDVFFNRKEPSLVFEEISILLMNVMYPINISTDHHGKVIEIVNHKEIVDRWSLAKKKLLEEYRSDLVFKLIKKFDKLIKDPIKLEIAVTKEIFWSLFFTKKYQEYGSSCKKKTEVYFSIEPYKTPLVYNGYMELNPKISEQETIELGYTAQTIIPEHSKLYYKRKEHKLTSELEISYDLDITTKLPIYIKASCDIYDETKSEDISQIQTLITLDETRTEKENRLAKEKKESIPSKEETPKKRKWFSFGSK